MSIKTKLHSTNPEYVRLMRKSDQEWEMAGLARQDGDKADADKHTALARKYQQEAAEHIEK